MKHDEENERIKSSYRIHLKGAPKPNDPSMDVVNAAIRRFDESSPSR
jgi:hypothetical protein